LYKGYKVMMYPGV